MVTGLLADEWNGVVLRGIVDDTMIGQDLDLTNLLEAAREGLREFLCERYVGYRRLRFDRE